eukprot:TRINITY_DN446_c0_g1_i1.p2 TRINITY_DN446_c0_g1~~TRINITY_DN446_c0_g1_i1.p2  ORF type:complete len:154 (-),score=28.29 TRINITY_DN446_c0_g1_i1:254-715(-)
MLEMLFGSPILTSVEWNKLLEMKQVFLTKQTARSMLGYITGFLRQLKYQKKADNFFIQRYFEVMWRESYKVETLLREQQFVNVFGEDIENHLASLKTIDFISELQPEREKISARITELEKEETVWTTLPENIDKKILNHWLLDIRSEELKAVK